MRVRFGVFIAGLVALLAMAGIAAAGGGGSPLSTKLIGTEEAPGPGDPDASGKASLRLNQGQRRLCFDIHWAKVDGEVFAGHIHRAPRGSPGPIVVDLFSGSFAGTDSVSGCARNVDAGLIKAIRKNPSAYYVNVHSRPGFTGGAVRGQLGR